MNENMKHNKEIQELREKLVAKEREILNLAELLSQAMDLIRAHNVAGYDKFWRSTGQQKAKKGEENEIRQSEMVQP